MKKKTITSHVFKNVNFEFSGSEDRMGGLSCDYFLEGDDEVEDLQRHSMSFEDDLWEFIKNSNQKFKYQSGTSENFSLVVTDGKGVFEYTNIVPDFINDNDVYIEGKFTISKKKMLEFLNDHSKKIK